MMDLAIQNFRGIRAVNPVVDVNGRGIISAVTCRNVELHYSENGDNVGIFTAKGNLIVATCPHKVVGQWESVQNRVSYHFVFAVDDTQGYLYLYKPDSDSWEVLKDGLSVTETCNGLTMAVGFEDWFVFTNGVDDYLGVCMAKELESERVKFLEANDDDGTPIRGLCLQTYDGRLVTNSKNRVHWSVQQNIFDWKTATDPNILTGGAYQEFDRDVTAMVYYNNMLIVFTEDYSTYFSGNPGNASSFVRGGATGGGCSGFKAVVKFDNKIFYYDPAAQNIFAYYLIDTGQTRPTNGLADNVIEFFAGIDSNRSEQMEIVPYISGDRSELWFKLPYLDGDKILIYDYLKSEWIERQQQQYVKGLSVIGGYLYSAAGNDILREYMTSEFAGTFIPAEYKMNIINVGSDSNLKVPKMPLILTLDFDYENDFYMEFIYDDRPERAKTKRIVKFSKDYLIWADDAEDKDGGFWATDEADENGGIWLSEDKNNVMFNLAGLLNFKQLQIRIYTAESGQEFGIKRIELKRVKLKTKTIG